MHPLGHITAACGTVWVGTELISLVRTRLPDDGKASDARRPLAHALDFRLVALGALLPDIIDRPIGNILFRDFFDANDHLFGHTIWFSLGLGMLGLALLRSLSDARLLGVAAGALTHLAAKLCWLVWGAGSLVPWFCGSRFCGPDVPAILTA